MRSAVALGLMCAALVLGRPAFGDDASSKSKFQQLTEGKQKKDGMWTLYQKDQQLLVELSANDLKKEYIVLASIARGIGSGMVLGGMSWNFGDDVIWKFRKADEKLYVLRRNVRYRARDNSPEATAVQLAYSDSVIYALPILTKTPSGGYLVDMTKIFMSDDQQIGREIGLGFRFASDRSTWAKVKAFNNNVELQVAAVYAGSRGPDTVPDPRGVQVNVHYSISALPSVGSNGYKPRMADDRVGYFLTVIKDFSDRSDDEHFVRYINRWDLRKKDPSVKFSPPAKPIRFYLEKTVPVFLRPTVKAGILEWNKAFEKLGYAGAIEVLQQEDNADWDPEDINYNTFRWITSDAGFAMGPSRVDPRTGQILDADIIFDAGFLTYWKQDYETFTAEDAQRLVPNWSPFEGLEDDADADVERLKAMQCALSDGMQYQMGVSAAMMLGHGLTARGGKLPEEFIHQGLKEVVMHEVGHTLGLRHNFKASSWKTLDEMTEESARTEGTVASVMDYNPADISPDPKKQGLYFTQTLGPYDYWAIEYGYTTDASKENLAKIAARSGEPGLEYATDEDTRSSDSDPLSNRFDLGKDPLDYVARQMEHAASLIPDVVDKAVEDGEGYQRARQAFGLLMSEYWRSALFASRFPGGVYVRRDHKSDDENARAPFEVVEAAKQRQATKLLLDSALAAPEFDGSLMNYLAASRWNHWGTSNLTRLDYPIHDVMGRMQAQVIYRLLNTMTLERLLDNEFKASGEEDVYTLAEHLRLITDGVFSEWSQSDAKGEYSAKKPFINSFRRDLQRTTLKEMMLMVTRGYGAPEDARTLARMHLTRLADQADALLGKDGLKLDDYSRAHLLDSRSRIRQVLEAELALPSVN
ncbi:zinc-dependent metalloprotease [Maioricimonas sp. JC845]|uniref:zinc-dependent metalloprotease n=1 Tax=Maioricimonas sp. JC845 TaxID=3232138 RepID=UPI0034590025